MGFEMKVTGTKPIQRGLFELTKGVQGTNSNWRPVWRLVGLATEPVFQDIFEEQGQRFGGWKDISPITLVLRAKGTRKKFKTLEQLDAATKTARKLIDTATGRKSFMPSRRRPGSVFIYNAGGTVVGSSLKYMIAQDKGGTNPEPFKFGKEQQYRLDKNFSKTLPGRSKKKTPTGRKSRAKKNWNEDYFILRGSMRKMDGKKFKLPPRQIEPRKQSDIKPDEMERINKAYDHGVDEMNKKSGLI